MTSNLFFKKTFFLLFIFLLFRIGSHITVPSINTALIEPFLENFNSSILSIINTFSGGSASRLSIMMLGIMPYITASIFVQIGALFIPKLKDLKESGEEGMVKLNRYTKYITFFIAAFQSLIVATNLLSSSYKGIPLVTTDILSFYIICLISLIGGTFITVWFAEKINEYAYGSGVTMMIFCGIIASLPTNIEIIKDMSTMQDSHFKLLFFILFIAILVLFIIKIETSRRNIKVISPNSKDGESNYPLKINTSSVMPAIFAFMILSVPQMVLNNIESITNFSFSAWWDQSFGFNKLFYFLFICCLIFFFNKIYTKSMLNTNKLAEQFKKNNTYIKGIRPNKPTIDYLSNIRSKLITISSFYLCIIVVTPEIFNYFTDFYFYLGGISLLILVNVAIEVKENFDSTKNKVKIEEIKKYNEELFR